VADVIGLPDVSSKDTGKGSKLKTGGKRSYNMPSKSKCASSWKQLGYKNMKDCMNHGKPAKAQKAGESAADQKDRVGLDKAESKERMRKKYNDKLLKETLKDITRYP
jgi:hypothetical protein